MVLLVCDHYFCIECHTAGHLKNLNQILIQNCRYFRSQDISTYCVPHKENLFGQKVYITNT